MADRTMSVSAERFSTNIKFPSHLGTIFTFTELLLSTSYIPYALSTAAHHDTDAILRPFSSRADRTAFSTLPCNYLGIPCQSAVISRPVFVWSKKPISSSAQRIFNRNGNRM